MSFSRWHSLGESLPPQSNSSELRLTGDVTRSSLHWPLLLVPRKPYRVTGPLLHENRNVASVKSLSYCINFNHQGKVNLPRKVWLSFTIQLKKGDAVQSTTQRDMKIRPHGSNEWKNKHIITIIEDLAIKSIKKSVYLHEIKYIQLIYINLTWIFMCYLVNYIKK